jgi:hypothetical protein
MQVTSVENILGNLKLIPLRALIPDREPYYAMLLQPQGYIRATDQHVGHANTEMGSAMCRSFFKEAVEKHAHLVVTPEYSVPWSVIEDIIEGRIRPDRGSIWILGCESITPDELTSFVEKFNDRECFFYHEPIDPAQKTQKRFIDPLLYVFWCHDKEGRDILSFVIQFKTTPCRDGLDVEQRSLYLGKHVYSFNRGINQISLLSIICSDAFEFTDALVNEYHTNCLLIHIQLCPKPGHTDFTAYRRRLCSVGSSNNVELLCLNWARGVRTISNSTPTNWNNNAGSAWYVPPSKFNCKDEYVESAHRAGIYYSIVSDRWHTFYLNYGPQIMLIQKQKLFFHGLPQALCPLSCLTVIERWEWNEDTKTWITKHEADDGFTKIANSYPSLSQHLPALAAISPLAVERALEFLDGPNGNPGTWFYLDEMSAMKVDEHESIRRITVHQEIDLAGSGVFFRRARLQKAQDAVTLPGQGVRWPDPVKDLEGGFRFQWCEDDPHRNVVSLGSGITASLVYLGDQSDDEMIDPVYRKVKYAIMQQAIAVANTTGTDLEQVLPSASDRLCVIFRRNHAINVWRPLGSNRIDRPPADSAVDIAGGEE